MNEVIAVITGITALCVAMINLFQLFRTKAALGEIHLSLNSRLTELLDTTAKLQHKLGKDEGRVEQSVADLKAQVTTMKGSGPAGAHEATPAPSPPKETT